MRALVALAAFAWTSATANPIVLECTLFGRSFMPSEETAVSDTVRVEVEQLHSLFIEIRGGTVGDVMLSSKSRTTPEGRVYKAEDRSTDSKWELWNEVTNGGSVLENEVMIDRRSGFISYRSAFTSARTGQRTHMNASGRCQLAPQRNKF